MKKIGLRIFHQIDIAGPVTGGVDSLIRSVVANHPDDFDVSVVGITSDPSRRPTGRWTDVSLAGRRVRFFAVGVTRVGMRRPLIPLTLRLMLGMLRYRGQVLRGADVMDFHRIEPVFVSGRQEVARNIYMHQDMAVIESRQSDIRWKHFPSLYYWLERRVFSKVQSVLCVRRSALERYEAQNFQARPAFRFLRTWADETVFYPPTAHQRKMARDEVARRFCLADDSQIVAWVGRLDLQKDPLMAIRAFRKAAPVGDISMLMVGDGVLRAEVEREIDLLGLQGRVRLVGLLPPKEVAEVLRAADVYLMTSAYEGMPVSMVEAMAVGLPVVSTEVGEVPLLVQDGVDGVLSRDVDGIAAGLKSVLSGQAGLAPRPSEHAKSSAFDAALTELFDHYRKLACRCTK